MITENLETLRQVSEDFQGSDEDLKTMFETLEFELENCGTPGVGLSAIQISVPYRVCIVRNGATKANLYNAEIIEKQQPFVYKGEGCLSLPGQKGETNRYNLVKVRNGDGEVIKFSGFDAIIVQHELDHWDGILFTDRAPTKED